MSDSFDELKNIFEWAGITEEDLQSMPKLSADRAALVRGLMLNAKKAIEGGSATIKFGIDDPLPGSGFISFLGDDIYIKDTAAFSEMCKLANVIEIYPMADGKITLELTFHNDKTKR